MPDMIDLTDTYFDEEECVSQGETYPEHDFRKGEPECRRCGAEALDDGDTGLDADDSRAEARLARKALGL